VSEAKIPPQRKVRSEIDTNPLLGGVGVGFSREKIEEGRSEE